MEPINKKKNIVVDVINIPPETGKLKDYQVYYNDTELNSKFFKISRFPEVLTSGKNYFLITGTDLLQPNTRVAIEVLDSKGNNINVEIPNVLVNGTDRIVVIKIDENDYYGDYTVTVLGEAIDVPNNWKGVYNVKWQKIVLCNPSLDNESDAIFYENPTVDYEEIYDNIGNITKLIVDKKTYNQGLMYSKIAGEKLSPLMSYQLYLTDGTNIITNSAFNSLDGWYTGSPYIDGVYVSASKLYMSQSYGPFGITLGVTQSITIKANKIYTLSADFIGSESNLAGSVAAISIYSGSKVLLYLYTTASSNINLKSEFSSSTDLTASIELGGQAFAIQTVWSNVFVSDLISGSYGNGFTKEMEGGYLEISASDMTIYPNTSNYLSSSYRAYISKVINRELAIANTSFKAYNTITKNYDRVTFISASYNITYGKTDYFGNDNIKNSYLKVKFRNLNTIVGSLKYIDLYKNPGNNYIGRYPVKPHEMLLSGSTFNSISDFNNNWILIESGTYVPPISNDRTRTIM